MSYIDIVPIGDIDDYLLLFLHPHLSQTFKMKTRIRRRDFDLVSVYDSMRNQYNSSGLLLRLINEVPPSPT